MSQDKKLRKEGRGRRDNVKEGKCDERPSEEKRRRYGEK